ncbi:MAG: LysM peptidoglycan-binding domain-containing protein [Microvirga sp.]|nr:LysM peptidoglycan-binding domain-containing protein [Microvirga sp.]
MSANHRFTVSLIVVVVLAVLGFGSWSFLVRDDGPPTGVAQQQPAPATVEPARDAGAPAPPVEAAAEAEAEVEVATEAEADVAADPVELAFDIVRVEPTGDAVIAGRAAPGARIDLLRNGETHDSLVVDATGGFAFVPPPLPAGASNMSLRATLPDGEVVTSRQSVTIIVDDDLTQQPMVAMVEPGEPTVVLSQPDAPAPVAAQGASGRPLQAATEALATAQAEPVATQESATPQAGAATPEVAIAEAQISEAQISGTDVSNPEAADVEVAEPDVAEVAEPAAAGISEVALTAEAETAAETASQVAVATETTAEPSPPADAESLSIRIASVEAETGGGLYVTGEGRQLAQVRLYLNDTFVARAQTDTAGAVSFAIGRGVMPGSYQVRLDEVADLTGQVVSRAEVSFEVPALIAAAPEPVSPPDARAETPAQTTVPSAASRPTTPAPEAPVAEAVAQASAPPAPAASAREPATVTIEEVSTAQVSRGDSLWRISRQIFGRGVRYTEIFEANKDQIRNPNLIYPGQIFVLPGDAEAAD